MSVPGWIRWLITPLCLLSGWLLTTAYVSEQQGVSLILAEYDPQASVNHIVHIKKIRMINGVASAPEVIMDIVAKKPDEKVPRIRFDLGPNQIYRNRYVITAYGNVVDLMDRKVLVDAHDRFVKASGDSIVFYTDDIFKGKYYSVLDLKSGKYEKVGSPLFDPVPGKDVEAEYANRFFTIWYFPPSAPKKELVKSAGYGEDFSLIPGGKPKLPMHWIDKDRFVYPFYNVSHTSATLMLVDKNSQAQTKLGIIDGIGENRHYSEFLRDGEGNLIYYCAGRHFKVDIQKQSVTEVFSFSAGNAFEISLEETPGKGHGISHKGQRIGSYFCTAKLCATAPGCIAFPYEVSMGEERYLQGAAYWSVAAGKWKTAGDSDLAAVVGWIIE